MTCSDNCHNMSLLYILFNTLNMPKKSVSKKQDWHRADIVAAVHKTGTSLQKMSRQRGYYPTALNTALNVPAPKYERMIAEHLGTTPQVIWPSRYHTDGSPRSGRGERGLGRFKAKSKFNGLKRNGNVKPVDNRKVA